MSDELAEVRADLRAVARELLAKTRDPSWPLLAASGWTGLEIPESFGGAGVSFAETAVICEELGRAASCTPYLGSAVLGVGTLLSLAPSPARDDLLRATAAGDAVPVAVLPGHHDFAPDAAEATHLLLVSPSPAVVLARRGGPGPGVGPGAGPGPGVETRPVLDETRRLARVTLDSGPVPDQAVPEGAVPDGAVLEFAGDPEEALARLLDRAAVAVACDSLGIAEAMLDRTVAYVKVREQFGRPVGSFQAVQHACADMLVAVRASRELVEAAVSGLSAGSPGTGNTGTGNTDAGIAAAMAKSYACAAAVEVAGKAMQLHGGIGYTWESGIHAFVKRAALNREIFGSTATHRKRIAARYDGGRE